MLHENGVVQVAAGEGCQGRRGANLAHTLAVTAVETPHTTSHRILLVMRLVNYIMVNMETHWLDYYLQVGENE